MAKGYAMPQKVGLNMVSPGKCQKGSRRETVTKTFRRLNLRRVGEPIGTRYRSTVMNTKYSIWPATDAIPRSVINKQTCIYLVLQQDTI